MVENGKKHPTEPAFGRFILEEMAHLGFAPRAGDALHVVFAKEYLDEGSPIRIQVFFDKPVMGLDEVRLSNIVITTQRNLEPTPTGVLAAPTVAREDLTRIITAFAAVVANIPDQHVRARVCIICYETTADYYTVNDDAVCFMCAHREDQP